MTDANAGALVRFSRRQVLRGLAAAAAAPAPLAGLLRPGVSAAAGRGQVPGWPLYVQAELGIAMQHPPGWTVRAIENGVVAVTEGSDGLTGARAYGQFLILNAATRSDGLAAVAAQYLALNFDGMRVAAPFRLSASPDLSAVRYTLPYVDGQRKGTLIAGVAGTMAVLLGLDAPAPRYASRVNVLAQILGTFRWFDSSLKPRQAVEPREGAFSAAIPQGWRATLAVVRPSIDAGFAVTASDPSGQLSMELHRPAMPGFAGPTPMLREGTWYDIGSRWGIQPLFVSRYLPGREYIRSFLLPVMRRTHPGVQLIGSADRPDLTLGPDAASARRVGGAPAGGEAEYAWTSARGTSMRGRAVVLTSNLPGAGGAPMLWGAPLLLLAEAPAPQLPAALAAMIAMTSSMRINIQWYTGELRGAAQRWRIIMDSETRAFREYEEVLLNRQNAALKAFDNWDKYIREGGAGVSNYTVTGPDTITTPDGKTHHVTGLDGRNLDEWHAKGGEILIW